MANEREKQIEEMFNDDTPSVEGMFIPGDQDSIIDLNSKEVSEFVDAAPLKEVVPSNDNKSTVVSFYVSNELLKNFNLIVKKNKIVKSKIIRAAEEIYFNSELNVNNSTKSSLEKRKNKLTCAFDKSELLLRAKEKGFKKITDYLNEVLIKKMEEVF